MEFKSTEILNANAIPSSITDHSLIEKEKEQNIPKLLSDYFIKDYQKEFETGKLYCNQSNKTAINAIKQLFEALISLTKVPNEVGEKKTNLEITELLKVIMSSCTIAITKIAEKEILNNRAYLAVIAGYLAKSISNNTKNE